MKVPALNERVCHVVRNCQQRKIILAFMRLAPNDPRAAGMQFRTPTKILQRSPSALIYLQSIYSGIDTSSSLRRTHVLTPVERSHYHHRVLNFNEYFECTKLRRIHHANAYDHDTSRHVNVTHRSSYIDAFNHCFRKLSFCAPPPCVIPAQAREKCIGKCICEFTV